MKYLGKITDNKDLVTKEYVDNAVAGGGGGVIPADYITDYGTSGGWYYRKYNSGYAECWGEFQFTGITVNTASAGTYYNSTSGLKSQSLPSGLFASVSYAEVTNGYGTHASGMYPYGVGSLTTSAVQIQFRAFASSSNVGCPAFIKVYGAWK